MRIVISSIKHCVNKYYNFLQCNWKSKSLFSYATNNKWEGWEGFEYVLVCSRIWHKF